MDDDYGRFAFQSMLGDDPSVPSTTVTAAPSNYSPRGSIATTSSAASTMASSLQPPQASLPQVTISHDCGGGSLLEFHPSFSSHQFPQDQDLRSSRFDHLLHSRYSQAASSAMDCTYSSSSSLLRAGRSHSLTPSVPGQRPASAGGLGPGGCGGPGGAGSFGEWGQKMRSNSLTLGPGGMVRDTSENKAIDEALARLPESSGMRELRDWMKSLRLHKYTDRLVGLTYEKLLTLTDSDLQKMVFTEGAKGKFMKQLALIKERPARIKELKQQLEEIVELRDLLQVLPEIEKIILMPLKPYASPGASAAPSQSHNPIPHPPPPSSAEGHHKSHTSSVDISAFSQAGLLSRQERRHDSGSDSGTELTEETHNLLSSSPAAAAAAASAAAGSPDNIPQLVFDLLEKTFSIIICKQHDDRDRDRVVLHFFRLVERRCLKKDAFNAQHKLWFQTWLKRMDQVWDITKSTEAALESKRKFDRKIPRDLSLRRSSIQSLCGPARAMPLGSFGPRVPSPISFKTSFSGHHHHHHHLGINPPITTTSSYSSSGHPPPIGHLLPERPPELTGTGGAAMAVQRRSVPDINTPSHLYHQQIKRNSYQGDHRMPPLVDSEILPNFLESSHVSSTLGMTMSPSCTSTLSGSSSSRRASTLSMSSWDSGYSRRNSSMSSDGSRRNSSMSDEGGRGDLFLHHGGGDSRRESEGYMDGAGMTAAGVLQHRRSFTGGHVPHPTTTSGTHLAPPTCASSSQALTTGSVSSGCASDEGSTTDSLEQDLHKLSLAVTEQALE